MTTIRRVPLEFDWPLNKVWEGFLWPDRLREAPCPTCSPYDGHGYSEHAKMLHNLWYGYIPFKPSDRGSTPYTVETPAVRAFAERNVARSPGFYGTGEEAIVGEATRLATHWNETWMHHLNADDVAALLAEGRLKDFTHTWDRANRWQPIDPPVTPTPEQVNVWSLVGFGHDSLNAHYVVRARCEAEGHVVECSGCDGRATVEAYPGQRAEAEVWEAPDPPTGDGWQAWEDVSEGSPISPVFATREGLVEWFTTPASNWGGRQPLTREQAEALVDAGHSIGSVVTTGDGRVLSGDEAVHELRER